MLSARLASRVSSIGLNRSCFFFSTSPIKSVGVVGLGLMGHGIAQVASQAGISVVAVDSQKDFLDKGIARINASLSKMAEKKVTKGELDQAAAQKSVSDVMSRITPSTDFNSLKDCDLIIEAIVENLDAKLTLADKLGSIAKPSAILASNTSSLPIIDIAKASGRPEKLVGIHFFNPVQLMSLVEVVKTESTDAAAFQSVFDFVKAIGKTPVSCKDTPGFIVNRLLVPFLAQALLLLQRGEGSIQDIDTAMRLGAGHPMGPIHLADYVGLDTTLFILQGWVQKYPNESAFVVPQILINKVKEGKLGRKSGEGFYIWKGDKIVGPSV